jgi:nitroreductase
LTDLYDGLLTTRAIRRLRPDPVSDDDLAAVLFAATRAPSGSNRQPFRFLVLRDGPKAREAKALLGGSFRRGWEAKRAADRYESGSGAREESPKARLARAMQEFVDNFERIPVVVLGCVIAYRGPDLFLGGSIYPACQNLLLAARSRGLGGVMTIWHEPVAHELRPLLDIPADVEIAATIPLGHPVGHHGPVRRRPISELVFDDVWGASAPWAVEPAGSNHTQAGPPR